MEVQTKKENVIVTYLKNQSKRDKIILAGTIILLTVTFGLKLLILPQLEGYTNNLNRLDVLQAEKNRVARLPQENQVLTEKAEQLKLEFDKAIEQLPKTPAVAQIVYDLENLIYISEVELKSLSFADAEVSESDIQPKDEVKTNDDGTITEVDRGIEGGQSSSNSAIESQEAVKKQVVNVSLSGEYKEIMKFVKQVENYSRISEVSNISLSKGEGTAVVASLTANFYNLNYEEKEEYDFNDGVYGREDAFN